MSQLMTEKDYLATIKAALAIDAISEVLDNMTHLAGVYIEREWTQEGADILAFVMRHAATQEDTHYRAMELWDDMERYICPRVLVDATEFGKKATLDDVVDYVFAE